MTYESAVESFIEQIEGLKAGGIDIVWIETMSARDEIRAAAEAAVRCGLPYVYTGSFDTAGKTMMGVHPRDIHSIASDIGEGPVAVGANCGVGASDILSSLLDMTAADPEAIVVVKGNCGIPEFKWYRDPLLRHAAVDGRLRPAGSGCRRAHHRRLLRHLL
jgi:methionine synthase I (cobalamin-dependent)